MDRKQYTFATCDNTVPPVLSSGNCNGDHLEVVMFSMSFNSGLLVALAFMFGPTVQFDRDSPPQSIVEVAAASFHEYDTGSTFDEVLASGTNVPKVVILPVPYNPSSGGGLRHAQGTFPNPHIQGLVATSGFVGAGTPLRHWSYATEGNQFAFSIYLVRVNSAIVGNEEGIASGKNIYVVRAGGNVTYKGHEIRAVDPDFDFFRPNEEYIFFGEELAPGLFKVNSDRVLQVHDGALSETTHSHRHSSVYAGRDMKSVLSEALIASQTVPANTRRRHQ